MLDSYFSRLTYPLAQEVDAENAQARDISQQELEFLWLAFGFSCNPSSDFNVP